MLGLPVIGFCVTNIPNLRGEVGVNREFKVMTT